MKLFIREFTLTLSQCIPYPLPKTGGDGTKERIVRFGGWCGTVHQGGVCAETKNDGRLVPHSELAEGFGHLQDFHQCCTHTSGGQVSASRAALNKRSLAKLYFSGYVLKFILLCVNACHHFLPVNNLI